MSTTRNAIIFVLALGFFTQFDATSYVVRGTWTSVAEAVVGRPATPGSVAGVARRTTRRCATGFMSADRHGEATPSGCRYLASAEGLF
jgi:hypothetical protein